MTCCHEMGRKRWKNGGGVSPPPLLLPCNLLNCISGEDLRGGERRLEIWEWRRGEKEGERLCQSWKLARPYRLGGESAIFGGRPNAAAPFLSPFYISLEKEKRAKEAEKSYMAF